MPDVILEPSGAVQELSICHGAEEFAASESSHNYNFGNTQAYYATMAELALLRMMQLEALMYAAYGSKAKSYALGLQWWLADDPRCMWGEFIGYNRNYKPYNKYAEYPWQTAARGSYCLDYLSEGHTSEPDTGYVDWARSVPLDWAQARFPAGRNTDFFPEFVVINDEKKPVLERTIFANNHGDPLKTEDVEVIYHAPAAMRANIETVTLHTRTVSMDGGGATDGTISMVLDGDDYKATIAHPASDRTFCSFYVRVHLNDESNVYDPPGLNGETLDPSAAPDHVAYTDLVRDGFHRLDDVPEMHEELGRLGYYVAWLEHKAPYEHGLPELLWKHYEEHEDPRAAMRRCTGIWRFEKWSDIKPGLINVARWCLDKLGDDYQHSPEDRGEAPACCIDMPIKWRWTGGAAPPHFHDGKPYWSEPLSNHPQDIPPERNESATKSWRGVSMLPFCFERNPANGGSPGWFYGRSESWRAKPTTAEFLSRRTALEPDIEPPGWFILAGRDAGLRKTDRVSVAHVMEVCGATGYLLSKGLWWVRAVETCKRTPTHSYPWLEGEYAVAVDKTSGPSTEVWDGLDQSDYPRCYHGGCWCPTNAQGQEELCDGYHTRAQLELHPYQAPANIAACRLAQGTCVSAGQCTFVILWNSTCPGGGSFDATQHVEMSDKLDQDIFHGLCGISEFGTSYGPEYELIGGASRGYSCYLCGPARVYRPIGDGVLPDGTTPRWTAQDEYHGNGNTASRPNGVHKTRVYGNHTDGAGKFKETKAMGNRAGRAVVCATEYTPGELDAVHTKNVAWDTVTAIQQNGVSTPWANPQWCSGETHCPYSGVDSIVPPIPGLEYWDVDVAATTEWIYTDKEFSRPALVPMCTYDEHNLIDLYENYPVQSVTCTRHSGNWPNCAPGGEGDKFINVYFCVDLNLDEWGVPSLYDYTLDIRRKNDDGTPHLIGGQPVYPDTPVEVGTLDQPYTWAWGDVICPECQEV
jgi:hypothetical protein